MNRQKNKIRKFSQIWVIAIAALFIFTNSADAKKMYPGYVVTADQDTIVGQIFMLSPAMNEIKVKMISEEGQKLTFKSSEVNRYAFRVPVYDQTEEQYFEKWVTYVRRNVEVSPVPFGPRDVLVQREEEGHISLFNYYVERNDIGNKLTHNFYIEHHATGEMVALDKNNYREILKDMTVEYPELNTRVGTKGFGFKYVPKMIRMYNSWMADNSEEVARYVE